MQRAEFVLTHGVCGYMRGYVCVGMCIEDRVVLAHMVCVGEYAWCVSVSLCSGQSCIISTACGVCMSVCV